MMRPSKTSERKALDDLIAQDSLTSEYIDEILGIGKTELVGVQEQYYEVAFDLSDKGFGSFDRCLHILTVC
jgi:hypothetical protein